MIGRDDSINIYENRVIMFFHIITPKKNYKYKFGRFGLKHICTKQR